LQSNVYVHDSNSLTTALVSHAVGSATTPANGASGPPGFYVGPPVISHDGSFIVFVSRATNLVANQTPSSFTNVFLYNNNGSGAVSLVSGAGGSLFVTGNGNSDSPAIDGDGGYVAYRSDAANLFSGTLSGVSNIYEYNRQTTSQALVSAVAGSPSTAAGGAVADAGFSPEVTIDNDGHLVSYVSTAGNAVPHQSGLGGVRNVFIWLRQTGASILASGQNGSPSLTGNADSDGPLLTRNSFPGFSSAATDLLTGVGGTSVAYLNTLVQVVLTGNSVADGSPAGTLVGSLSVTGSVYAGAYLPPTYTVVAGPPDDSAFTVPSGSTSLYTAATLRYVQQANYQVSVDANIGFGDDIGTLAVSVIPPVISGTGLVGFSAQTGQWLLDRPNAANTFTPTQAATWAPDNPGTLDWVDVQVGDFNGGGLSDVAARWLETGQWWVGLSDGQGHFTTSLWDTWSPQATWVQVQVGDINGDGKADLIGRYYQTGQWWAALSNGSSFINALWDTWAPDQPGLTWVDVHLADLNGDGKPDLLGRYLQTGQWWAALSGVTPRTNGLWATWNPAATWVDVQVGDVNGDGKADVIGRYLQAGQWWAGLSSGTGFTNVLWDTWSPAVTWVDVRLADLTGDGKADLIGRYPQTGQWWTGISGSGGAANALWATWSPAVAWANVQAGDFNGDGKADLAAEDPQSGQWWVGVSSGAAFQTTLWDTWVGTATNVQAGRFS
jgi:hypothetical protein